MSHTPHELADTFPQHRDRIHQLKVNDPHFARMADEYHTINREIHRIESEVEPASDDRLEDLKKQRLHLADEVGAMLATAG